MPCNTRAYYKVIFIQKKKNAGKLTTSATKDSDTARIGIFRLFASELATDAIVKDMSERFLADKGMNGKCNKLYYELLTKYDLGDEMFSKIVFESIPLQYKINSVMNSSLQQ